MDLQFRLQNFKKPKKYYLYNQIRLSEGVKYLIDAINGEWLLKFIGDSVETIKADPQLTKFHIWYLEYDEFLKQIVILLIEDFGKKAAIKEVVKGRILPNQEVVPIEDFYGLDNVALIGCYGKETIVLSLAYEVLAVDYQAQ